MSDSEDSSDDEETYDPRVSIILNNIMEEMKMLMNMPAHQNISNIKPDLSGFANHIMHETYYKDSIKRTILSIK
jgi:hypothetical protein